MVDREEPIDATETPVSPGAESRPSPPAAESRPSVPNVESKPSVPAAPSKALRLGGEEKASKREGGASVPAYYKRRKKRGNEICQILIRNGDVDPVDVRRGLKLQEERGGQIGRILVSLGACSEEAIARALLQQLQLRSGSKEEDLSLAARENPAIAGLKIACSPLRTQTTLVLGDVFSFTIALVAGLVVDHQRTGVFRLDGAMLSILAGCIGLIAFRASDLYTAMAPSPPDELRASTQGVLFASVATAAIGLVRDRFSARTTDDPARFGTIPSLFAFLVVAVALVPLVRAFIRQKFSQRPWWGHPVVVLGAAKTGRLLVRALRTHPGSGLKPVVLLDDDRRKQGTLRASIERGAMEVRSFHMSASDLMTESTLKAARDLLSDSTRRAAADILGADVAKKASEEILGPSGESAKFVSGAPESTRWTRPVAPPATRARGKFAEVEGVPVVGDLSLAPVLAKRLGIAYAVLAMPGVSSKKLVQISERVGGVFSHVLIIPDLFGFATLGVPARNLAGVLGIEVRQQLLLRGPRAAKRFMDLALTIVGGLCILPVLLVLSLLIKIDSKGPVLYFQERLGRDGTRFRAAKFRSMHGDGEARLKAVLDADPRAREEYEEFHKLTNDPRVTRIGRVIRKYSLDELPQLWNVLRGEMSLVGPRPYLEREIPDMEQQEGLILRALPGMTGMWQVSDRNSTGFASRIAMDVYYVRNWSPWLDIYVLARTFGVVVRGTGS